MRLAISLIVCLLLGLTAIPSVGNAAWSASGHKTMASICYRNMQTERRTAIAGLLREHPRYAEDFEEPMPAEVRQGNKEQQEEWLFQQAASWPDMVRSGPKERRQYNRPKWHYINRIHFLTDEDRAKLEATIDAELDLEPPKEFDDRDMNVVQAIKNSLRILKSDENDGLKAIHVRWLLHCVGDLHQRNSLVAPVGVLAARSFARILVQRRVGSP